MDERRLIAKLKDIKRELLALKTAHNKGLGTASFDSKIGYLLYTTMASVTQYLKITIKFADTVVESPFAQCYLSNTQYFQPYDIKWNPSAHTVVFSYMCYVTNVSLGVYTKVIATAGIESITMEAVDIDELV